MKSITFFAQVVLISYLLWVPVAIAQVDPDPDGVGIYFDTAASVECPLHPSSGDQNLPVARINGDAPVRVETDSWSRIKAMFR